MTTYPRLISAEQLKERIDDPNLRIVHVVETRSPTTYFLPGSAHVTPRDLISGLPPASGKLPPLRQLESVLGSIGYNTNLTFVVCDDEGGGWAGRLAWTLDAVGHHQWLYLDGGIHAWAAAGYELATSATSYEVTEPQLTLNEKVIAEIPDVLKAIDDEDSIIWDCRSIEEFVGIRQSARRAGHIPSAIHLDWLDLMDRSNNLELVKNLSEKLEQHGISESKDVITHCQTHHRSGLSYMCARILGFERIRAYHGSWSEWGNRDDTPVVQGSV